MSSRGEDGQADENPVVVSEKAPKCYAGQWCFFLDIVSDYFYGCSLAALRLSSLSTAVCIGQCAPCHNHTVGWGRAKAGYEALPRFGSRTQHKFSCMNCFFNVLSTVSVNRKRRQLREQGNHKIWTRPQESKVSHSYNFQVFSQPGRGLVFFLTYFLRSGFATLETRELLSQTIVFSWLSSINNL